MSAVRNHAPAAPLFILRKILENDEKAIYFIRYILLSQLFPLFLYCYKQTIVDIIERLKTHSRWCGAVDGNAAQFN